MDVGRERGRLVCKRCAVWRRGQGESEGEEGESAEGDPKRETFDGDHFDGGVPLVWSICFARAKFFKTDAMSLDVKLRSECRDGWMELWSSSMIAHIMRV